MKCLWRSRPPVSGAALTLAMLEVSGHLIELLEYSAPPITGIY
jgi:hypothetical protein